MAYSHIRHNKYQLPIIHGNQRFALQMTHDIFGWSVWCDEISLALYASGATAQLAIENFLKRLEIYWEDGYI